MTPQVLSTLMNVNLGAALWLTQAVAPYCGRRARARSSTPGPGREWSPGAATYGVTKAALAHLGRILDLELRPHGIRVNVNVILPQLIATAGNKAVLPSQSLARAATPEAVASVITSLAGSRTTLDDRVLVPLYDD